MSHGRQSCGAAHWLGVDDLACECMRGSDVPMDVPKTEGSGGIGAARDRDSNVEHPEAQGLAYASPA